MLLTPSLPMSVFTVTAKEYPKGTPREPAVPVTKPSSRSCAERMLTPIQSTHRVRGFSCWHTPVLAGTGGGRQIKNKKKVQHTFPKNTTLPSCFPADGFHVEQWAGSSRWHLTQLPLLTALRGFESWSDISSCLQMLSGNRWQLLLTNINVLRVLN